MQCEAAPSYEAASSCNALQPCKFRFSPWTGAALAISRVLGVLAGTVPHIPSP